MSLVARHLESNGIPTVIIGSARDVVEYCGVPRFLYVDFPLGNPCGKPGDREMQLAIVRQALALFDSAPGPRSTVRAPFEWSADNAWRDRYAQVHAGNRDALRRQGERRRALQEAARAAGESGAPLIDG